MDGDHGRTVVLHPLGKIQHIDGALVPTQTAFYRHRHIHRLDNSGKNFSCQLRSAHETAAITGIGDFGHGATHIDVQKITAGDLKSQSCTLGHHIRVVAKDLRAAKTSLVLLEQCGAFLILVHQRPGGHHFRDRDICTQLSTHRAERQIRHAGHRPQSNGIIHFQVTDLQRPRPLSFGSIIA